MKARDQSASERFDALHRQSARATSIIGGAAIVNILLGLVRMKIAAIILGPVGIGMIGLLQNLLNTAATVAGLNLGVAGARQIVASQSVGPPVEAAAKRAVLVTTCSLALGSGLVFWLFREPLAALLFQDRGRGREVGWLAVGVAATAAAGYQMAILSAGRRIGDIARLNLLTAAASALVGGLAVIAWKGDGILPFILATPIATLAFGWVFVRRRAAAPPPFTIAPLGPQVVTLLKLGAALTVSIFVSLCGQLAIRTLVERKLGAVALGHFQAAWTLTTVYLAFIFQTMASDYLPRLTAAIADRRSAQKLIESQAEVGILLAAPILLAMIGGAPWILSILYTGQFVEATALLRYQMFGDLVRLMAWPVALVLLAAGANRAYAAADILGTAILVAMTFILLPVMGLAAPGVAYLIMNLAFASIVILVVRRRYSVGPGRRVAKIFGLLVASSGMVFAIGVKFLFAGTIAGAAAAACWALWAWRCLGPPNLFGRLNGVR